MLSIERTCSNIVLHIFLFFSEEHPEYTFHLSINQREMSGGQIIRPEVQPKVRSPPGNQQIGLFHLIVLPLIFMCLYKLTTTTIIVMVTNSLLLIKLILKY